MTCEERFLSAMEKAQPSPAAFSQLLRHSIRKTKPEDFFTRESLFRNCTRPATCLKHEDVWRPLQTTSYNGNHMQFFNV